MNHLKMEIKTGGQTVVDSESESGFSAFFAGGREWWVSDNWGLGVGAEIEVGSIKEEDTEISLGSFSIYFSATYH